MLRAYYTLDESSGSSTVSDSAGSNDGTVNGASLDSTGILGTTCAGFDGSSNAIELGNVYGAGKYTLTAWVKFNSTGSTQIILQAQDADAISSNWRVQLRSDGSSSIELNHKDSSNISNSATGGTLVTDTWHHAAASWDGSVGKVFLDGQEVSSTNIDSIYSTPNDWSIGYSNHADSQYLNGSLDEVRIYDHALSPNEVQYLYEVGHHGSYVSGTKTL